MFYHTNANNNTFKYIYKPMHIYNNAFKHTPHKNSHTHTHTHIYIYIYIHTYIDVCICVWGG